MNDNQTLEVQIKSTAQQATADMNALIKSMTNVEKTLKDINKTLNDLGNQKSNINKLSDSISDINSSANKANIGINRLLNNVKRLFTFSTARRLSNSLLDFMDTGIDYTEQLNLFNVVFKNVEKNGIKTFSTLGAEATKYQNKLNEAFGTNKTETLYMQAMYQSMGENAGIKDKYASIMSEAMTNLTYDLSSLYNKNESDVAGALRAGVYAGQTKPLRSYGIDVTQNTMAPLLESLGITDRTVSDLSYAEKEILRYIATLNQAKVAMGDMANTIESPSNQLKVFRQQLEETKIALSSLFIGAYKEILPYVNAFLMVIKEIAKALADMFGIELVDYNSGIASSEDAYESLGDSIDGATKKVKELKRQTLGFDEIHNINENKDNGNGGSALVGGIDQRLLDAITGYDNGLDKVRMKATEIRDQIMDWLGFTKEIDPLTGAISFKLRDGETRFSKILDFIKTIKDVLVFGFNHIQEIITVIAGYKILKFLGNVFDSLKKISGLNFSNLGKFSQIGLAVGGSALLSEGISKIDPNYEKYVKLIMGENYDGPTDIFGMWSEIGKGISESSEQKKGAKNDIYNDIYNDIFKSFAMLDKAKQQGQDTSAFEKNLDNALELYFARYVSPFDYSKYLSVEDSAKFGIGALKGDEALEKALEGFKDQMQSMYAVDSRAYLNKFFGESFFGNSDAFNITSYTEQVQTYFSTIVEGYDILDGYKEKINENNKAYSETSMSLGKLISSMTNPNYKVTEKEIEKINELLKKMGTISSDTAEENYLAVAKIMNNLNSQGYASDELTQKIIDNAYKQKLAEQGMIEAEINAYMELERQLKNNEITEEEFKKKVYELSQEFSKNDDIVKGAIISFENLANNVDITAGSYDEIESAVSDFASVHAGATKTIKDGTKEQIKLFENYQATIDRTTEEGEAEYQGYAETISKLRQKEKDDLKKLDDQYAISMSNILRSMVNSKEHGTKEMTKMEEAINEELKKIGKGVDLSGNVANINRQLDNIKNPKVTIDVDANTTKATTVFDKLKSTIANTFGGLGAFLGGSGGGFRANGGIYSNGTWRNIPQYANGGIPSHGSLVFAGENGPEIMGNINGKTEILNKSQIASSIYQAVASAMSQYGGQSQAIELYAHTDEGIVIDRINQTTKQTGVCPIIF